MNNNGQSLIEALVALGAAVIIVSAVAIAVITSVNNADYSKVQNQATAYAQEEMEILHQQSRADWTTFNSYNNTYCVGSDGIMNNITNACSNPDSANIGTLFKRQVEINKNDSTNCSSATKVTVTVSWKDGRCPSDAFCHNTKLESCFTNINALPTP